MNDILTVIFGAGASYDCVVSYSRDPNNKSSIPLTDKLFDTRYYEILDKYPGARGIGQVFKRKAFRDRNLTLEQYLRELLTKTDDKDLQTNVGQIPLYLRELIGEAGKETLDRQGSTGYEELIDHLAGLQYKTIILITLNWDLLLDRALQNRVHMRFVNHDMSSYLGHRKRWYLIKFHGSVNWVKKLPFGKISSKGDPLETVTSLDPNGSLIKNTPTEFLDDFRFTDGSNFFFPVMVLPHDQQKIHICPDSHYQILKSFLPKCQELWIIGNSMRDQDIVEVIERYARSVKHLKLVDYFQDQHGDLANDYEDRIRRRFFQEAGLVRCYDGFRRFVEELP